MIARHLAEDAARDYMLLTGAGIQPKLCARKIRATLHGDVVPLFNHIIRNPSAYFDLLLKESLASMERAVAGALEGLRMLPPAELTLYLAEPLQQVQQ